MDSLSSAPVVSANARQARMRNLLLVVALHLCAVVAVTVLCSMRYGAKQLIQTWTWLASIIVAAVVLFSLLLYAYDEAWPWNLIFYAILTACHCLLITFAVCYFDAPHVLIMYALIALNMLLMLLFHLQYRFVLTLKSLCIFSTVSVCALFYLIMDIVLLEWTNKVTVLCGALFASLYVLCNGRRLLFAVPSHGSLQAAVILYTDVFRFIVAPRTMLRSLAKAQTV